MAVFENFNPRQFSSSMMPPHPMAHHQFSSLYSPSMPMQSVSHMPIQHMPVHTMNAQYSIKEELESMQQIALPIRPRVVEDQRKGFNNSEILKRLSKVNDFRYAGSMGKTIEDRRAHLHSSIKTGMLHVAFKDGTNIELAVSPIVEGQPSPELTYDLDQRKIHIKSKLIMDGVCVIWNGTMNLETLEGQACLQYDEDNAKVEEERASNLPPFGFRTVPFPCKDGGTPPTSYLPGASNFRQSPQISCSSTPSPKDDLLSPTSDTPPSPSTSTTPHQSPLLGNGFSTSTSGVREQAACLQQIYHCDPNYFCTNPNFDRYKDLSHKRPFHRTASQPYPSPMGTSIKTEADRGHPYGQ